MNKRSLLFFLFKLTIIILLVSCKTEEKEELPYFEGEIKLSESRGLYGSLFKVHTTYTIAENYFKREQRLGGVNSVFSTYAGIIIDLKKDSVILYSADKLSGKKNKHTTTIKAFKTASNYKNFPNSLPSPVDNTFKLLPNYNLKKQVEDSTLIKNFKSDYTQYIDNANILKQDLFNTKKIRIKRAVLEMVFPNIPNEINFVLKSDLKTTISNINNDSIISGEQTKALDLFVRDVFNKDKTKTNEEATNLNKLAKNKWVKMGLNLIKKGVDLNFHITTNVSELTTREILLNDIYFPSLDIGFDEIEDIEDFMSELPSEGGGDFDGFDD